MLTVMVVDDMEVVRRQVKRLRIWGEATGFTIVDEAEDGQEAIQKLEANPVDLVITDIRMPKVDGIELLRAITVRKLAACVVFLSDYSEFSYAKEGFRYGAFDYIVKPVKGDELLSLLEKVRKHIGERRQEQERIRQLEEKLVERVETLYPAERVSSIIEFICEGSMKAVEAAENMVEATAAVLDNDGVKTAVVLQSVLAELRTAIQGNYPWLERFTDLSVFANTDLTKCPDTASLKAAVLEIIESLLTCLRKFECGFERNTMVKQVYEFVLANVEKEITITTISEALYLTKSHICEVFKQKTGMTVGEYITMAKMERAKKLLMEGTLKNYEIADRLNYKEADYFSKLFKKYTGVSPADFRRKRNLSIL